MKFIGIGRNVIKLRFSFLLLTIFRLLIQYIRTASIDSTTPLIVKY